MMEVLGSSTIPSNIPAYFRPLSLRLFSVMDDIGASEEVRKLRIESSVTNEILWSVHWHPEESIYYFGSQADGTTTRGMASDLDVIRILNNLPVVTDPSQQPIGNSLLFIQDNTTPAGYCKLQLVQDGVLQYGDSPAADPYPDVCCKDWLTFSADAHNRLVCWFKPSRSASLNFDQRHGPALTQNEYATVSAVDQVFAVECKDLPECTLKWVTRRRDFNWPTSNMIQTCQTYGSLLVPVGHPLSEEQEQQWRVSLSHQEKLLVIQFNTVQYKCFILLKMIKKEFINYQVPDSLSSYHIKTCMFYMSENTPGELWKPENLLSCVNACLNKLLQWVQDGYCPNYFIPEENMFERRVYGEVRTRLQQVLQQLVSAECKFLSYIKCDKLGERFIQSFLSLRITTGADYQCENDYFKLLKLVSCRDVAMECFRAGIMKLSKTSTTDIKRTLKRLLESVCALQRTSTITRHTNEETRKAKSLIMPYLELSLMTNSVAFAINQSNKAEEVLRLLSGIRWKEITFSSDSFSSRLKQASLLYMCGHYQESLCVLSELVGLVRFTLCRCFGDKGKIVRPDIDTLLGATRGVSEVTQEYLLRELVIPCVYFLPTERNVTPAALCYEMERMSSPRPASNDDLCINDKRRGDWAFVDGNFLLHFLLYLNHNRLDLTELTTADINNMKRLIQQNNTNHLSHIETCVNLLGWIFKEKGCTDAAELCFRESLKLKYHYNAAVLHIMDLP